MIEILFTVLYVLGGLLAFVVLIGLYASYLRVPMGLDKYLDEKDIILDPVTKKEVLKLLRNKFYFSNIYVIGPKGSEIEKKIDWFIRTELVGKLEKNRLSEIPKTYFEKTLGIKGAIVTIFFLYILIIGFMVFSVFNPSILNSIISFVLMITIFLSPIFKKGLPDLIKELKSK